ncbi:C-type lectin domain family 4 member E-like [Poeciliopsis prolifica]|uniref:C-type lectin domain family 4 member E-like n=1 Tax=Poeciliopsis prolifica TaxID=188132 RepID=UPI002413902A|nr:C-type lectin domain family 4 member E-like [Poeciliopsis prolifica]
MPARGAVLLVLVGLLAAAFIVIYRLSFLLNNQTLQTLKEENEALRRNLSEFKDMKPGSSTFTTASPGCPKPPSCPSCPSRPSCPTCPPPPKAKSLTCLKCETGWEPHGGNCYYFSSTKSSWTDSRRFCINRGSDLVKIDSREEQMFLEVRLRGLMEDDEDKFWIGLTDSKTEGKWLWMDGSPLDKSLSFWSLKEPDNWRNEDCVRMGERGGTHDLRCWFDKDCNVAHKSICEKPAAAHHCV